MQRKITCGCGNTITTNMDQVDCLRCGVKIFFVEPKEKKKDNYSMNATGLISIEQELKPGAFYNSNLSIKVGINGRIWIDINGRSLLRFNPKILNYHDVSDSKIVKCDNCHEMYFRGDIHVCDINKRKLKINWLGRR